MSILERSFGKTKNGEEVKIFTLLNYRGMKVEIMELGAAIVSMIVPDKKGHGDDVVLGFDSLENYEKQTFYMGAVVGRCANRIGKSEFKLNGIKYKLTSNEGENHLHGGTKGFDKRVWKGEVKSLNGIEWLEMTYHSADMEEGYPGNLEVSVSYYLTDNNSLEIEYYAISDKHTIVNLTSHPYFNLKGHGEGDILGHELQILGKHYTELGSESLLNGKIVGVEGTPMDFLEKKKIGEDINKDFKQLKLGNGYDHNWVLDDNRGILVKCAVLSEESSGRVMEMQSTLPGLQFYSGNYLNSDILGKNGAIYAARAGLCLEAQLFPDSMKYKDFPSVELQAYEKYRHKTVYRFR